MKYSSYKTIFVPLLLLFLLFAPKTWAQENQKQVPGLLINHHFFAKEMPMQEIFSVQKGFQRLDDGEQHSVLRVLVPADFVIPKAWKKYEIARENVVNADKFEAGARLFDEMAVATHSGDKQLTAPKIGQKLPGTFTLHDINGGTWTQDSLQPLSNKGNVEKENHIDTITKFLEDLRKLGEQLSYIQEEQKNLLARMLNLKQQEGTETLEYAQLAGRSKDLQAQIDKYRPIYEERMAWIKDIKKKGKKR